MKYLLAAAMALAASPIGALANHDNSARLTKPPLTNNLDYLKQGLEDHLGWPAFHWDIWVGDWIPHTCKTIAEGWYLNTPYFSPYDFEVYNAHYDDCGWWSVHIGNIGCLVFVAHNTSMCRSHIVLAEITDNDIAQIYRGRFFWFWRSAINAYC